MMSLESRIARKNDRLAEEAKLLNLLNTWHKVSTENDDNFNDKLVWCLEHCQGKFRDIKEYGNVTWFFQNEQDATMFSLKWA